MNVPAYELLRRILPWLALVYLVVLTGGIYLGLRFDLPKRRRRDA